MLNRVIVAGPDLPIAVRQHQYDDRDYMATAKLQGLPAADFERLADLTQLKEAARAMAREYFVNSRSLTDIAKEFDTSKQRVSLAVASIRRVHETAGVVVQRAWVRFEEEVPEGIHSALDSFVAELKKRHPEAVRKAAIDQVARALERATWSMK